MGDWCGSATTDTKNRNERNNGCVTGRKRYRAVGGLGQEKIDNIFFDGEVFFLLTGPLMGDPF